MDIIKTLLSVYCGILALNIIFSLQLVLTFRTRIYMAMLGLWVSTLINFILQLIANDSALMQVLAYSTYISAAFFICYIITSTSRDESFVLRFGKYWLGWFAAVILSVIIANTTDDFLWIALPVALSITLPQVIYSFLKLTKYSHCGTQFSNTFALISLLNGLHFLDYPWLRPDPEMALFGFSFVIATSMILASLLPAMLTKFHSDALTKVLRQEIETKKKVERELAASLMRARHLARVKSEFLANMSHEIRTPINGIVGYNGMLLEMALSPEQREYCQGINKSGERLLNIVNSVLNLSKLESGTIIVRPKKFLLEEFIYQIENHYQTVSKNCVIECRAISPLPRSVITDESKLEQVIFNLVNNAIKYSHSKTVTVKFGFEPEHERQLVIEISDNGVGISPKKIATLFKRFEQEDHGKDGVGLGLSITHQLVEVLKGRIAIQTAVKKGTTFIIEIPVEVSHTNDEAEPKEPMRLHPDNLLGLFSGQSKSVLLVEDDPVNQSIFKKVIESMGLACQVSDNINDAFEQYSNNHFDLVFTDIQLPDGTGIDLITWIRQSGSPVPIIACSAFAFDEDAEVAVKAGATSYLRKPVSPSQVKQSLANCLNYNAPLLKRQA